MFFLIIHWNKNWDVITAFGEENFKRFRKFRTDSLRISTQDATSRIIDLVDLDELSPSMLDGTRYPI